MDWYKEVIARKEELLDDLQQLLKIPSVKDLSTSSLNRPMGQNIGEALDFMLRISDREGFKTKNIQGYVGYAEYGSKKENDYIGVLCHLDVVPATGNWICPPFEPMIHDGKLYARGAIDDKGPTIAAFYGLKILKQLGLPLHKNVRLIFGTDEESGSRCMKKYQEVETMPTYGFAPDAVFPIINAEKGQINMILSIEETSGEQTPFKLHTFNAGSKINMVPETAKATVSGDSSIVEFFNDYCKNQNVNGRADQKQAQVEFTISGVSAHGMEPEKGINAGLLLAHFLSQFPFQKEANQFLSFINSNLVSDFKGEKLGIDHFDDMTGNLTVNAGILNFEESKGAIHLNVRCPVTTNYDQTKQRLTHMAEKYGFYIEELRESKPHYVSKEEPIIVQLQNAYFEETSLEPVLLSTGGGTYAKYIEKGVAFGAAFPGKEYTAHQENEYIDIDDLLKATAIYARAIYALANLD